MDPITGALISGGASLLGNLFSSQQSGQNVQAQNQATQQMLTQQESYNTQMSNTAYQRASADMKAAGLNPMMMFGSGSAASSPSVSMAVPSQAKTSALGDIGPAMHGAIASAVAMKTMDKTSEEIANLQVENKKLAAGIDLLRAQTDTEKEKPRLVHEEGRGASSEADIKQASIPIAINEGLRALNEYDFRSTAAGKLLDQAGMAGRKVSDVLSPVSNLVSSARSWKGLFGSGSY